MDYDTVELFVAAVLVLLPIAAVSAVGMWCLGNPPRRMPWFFFLGPAASLIYGGFAGPLGMALFPPPFDAYLDSGRGLDLRGTATVFGAMLGGAAGVVTSVVLCIANLVRQFVQEDRPAARARLNQNQSLIRNGS